MRNPAARTTPLVFHRTGVGDKDKMRTQTLCQLKARRPCAEQESLEVPRVDSWAYRSRGEPSIPPPAVPADGANARSII